MLAVVDLTLNLRVRRVDLLCGVRDPSPSALHDRGRFDGTQEDCLTAIIVAHKHLRIRALPDRHPPASYRLSRSAAAEFRVMGLRSACGPDVPRTTKCIFQMVEEPNDDTSGQTTAGNTGKCW